MKFTKTSKFVDVSYTWDEIKVGKLSKGGNNTRPVKMTRAECKTFADMMEYKLPRMVESCYIFTIEK